MSTGLAAARVERRILRVVPSYLPYVTGPTNQAQAISRGLRDSRYESTVVTTDLGVAGQPLVEEIDGVPVRRCPIRGGFMQYHVAPSAWRELNHRQADLVHVHSYRSFLADAAAVAARRRGLPFVLQLHGSLTGYRRIVQGRRRRIYELYDLLTRPLPTLRPDRIIVSTSQEAREVVGYGVDAERISVIPMGVEVARYHFPDAQRDPRRVLFVGRIEEGRRVEHLLEALAMVSDLDWHCRIVGGEERRSYASARGYLAGLRRRAGRLGIADRVEFIGPMYGSDLRREYACAGVFAYPSAYENFGQTILEAAAGGCALLTTSVGVAENLVRGSETGYTYGHGDVRQMAQQLRVLLRNRDEQARMGGNAQALAEREYAWGQILLRYANLYDDLLGRVSTEGKVELG